MMDAKINIQDCLRVQNQDRDFKPRVHAELNLLEYFHTGPLHSWMMTVLLVAAS